MLLQATLESQSLLLLQCDQLALLPDNQPTNSQLVLKLTLSFDPLLPSLIFFTLILFDFILRLLTTLGLVKSIVSFVIVSSICLLSVDS